MVEQLVLSLPVNASHDADDFLISDCNASAAALIRDWPRWPGRACVIVGPAGSGKSHLTHVWRAKSGAQIAAASDIRGSRNTTGPLVVEDVDRGGFEDRAFFHLLNLSRETGFDLLLTARTPPGEWEIALPDLRSRFRSLTVAVIGEPDDGLLRSLLVKHFADRQLSVQPDVIDYLLRRMDRTAAAAGEIVARLDNAALSSQRRITRVFAGALLGSEFDDADSQSEG